MLEKIYAFLLRLYPAEFRDAYGREALQLIRDRARDERGIVLKLRLSFDLATDLLAMRFRSRHERSLITAGDSRDSGPSFPILEWVAPRPEPLAVGMLLALVMIVTFAQTIHVLGDDGAQAQLRTLHRLQAGFFQSSPLRQPSNSARPARQNRVIQRSVEAGQASAQASPQPNPFVAKLLQNRYPLSVRGGELSGAGADVLRSAIGQSRFVLLGEYHGVAQTPEFLAGICNAAGPEGFHTMAVEEGPLAAAELESWARRPDGLQQFAAFQKKSPETINVSNAREEFDMLQQCARVSPREFRLWGLNQEMFGASGLLLSRVLASGVGNQARPAIELLLQKSDEADRKARQSGNLFDLFMFTADDGELAAAAALLQKDGTADARALFASLVESHEINRRPPAEYGNARRRERLMKMRFAANYARASRTAAQPPKILLKFGAFHGYRGLNPVHGSGIGNYIAEFAEAQNAQSLHILFVPAKAQQFNLESDPSFRYLQPALANLLPSDWTMFDVRQLRQEFNGSGAAANRDAATLVFGYDIVVIVPEGRPATAIR
jgi:hypothetical protein